MEEFKLNNQDRIDYLLEYGQDILTDWELDFLDNTIRNFDVNELSWRHQKKLIEIHRRIEGIVK